jgi:AcrR family transcriptional regulator
MSYYCDMEVTKKRIIDAAIIVFNNDPSGTLEMVADKADITTRTLYRYFKDRKVLLEFCRQEMALTCKAAMSAAFESSTVPIKQLELSLYACIDCGSKYAFFDKTNQRSDYQPSAGNEENREYNDLNSRWIALIITLQKEDIVTNELTPDWIQQLFSGMINTTLRAISSGNIAPNDIKKFAWYSFSKSIGISESDY